MTKLNIILKSVGTESILLSSKVHREMFYGHPLSGPMDIYSYDIANQILHNPKGTPAIECSILPPKILFEKDALISLTGADMFWRINKQKVARNKPLKIKAGDILSGKPSREFVRSYIGIQGLTFRKDLPLKLIKDLRYTLNRKEVTPKKRLSKIQEIESLDFSKIKIEKGPEWSYLDQKSKEILIEYPCSLNTTMNRMGVYINGPKLDIKYHPNADSKCTFAGAIQLLPSGQLIVLLNDGQITGGYPRVAYINYSDLSKFNQIMPGREFVFSML